MRIFLVAAVLGLMLVEGFLLPRTVRDSRIMRKMRTETAPSEGRPVAIGPFAGYDAAGRPLTLVTDDTRWIVPVIIHSTQMASDFDYVSRLRKAIPSRTIVVVGVCDTSRCGDRSRPDQVVADFPILAYGSYAPLQDIARFDNQNQVLLTNQFWGVKESLRRTASVEELAAEVLKATGP